jgi:hypothetical protein
MKPTRFLRAAAALILTVMLFFSLSAVAFADVIWLPENSFLQQNEDQCAYHNRSYLVNAQAGYAQFFSKPGGRQIVWQCVNGTEVLVGFVYQDAQGARWGLCEFGSDSGWVDMQQLALIYDAQSFWEEHEPQIVQAEAFPADYVPTQPIFLWQYPGSGVITGKIGEKEYDNTRLRSGDVYTDDQGGRWLYVPYYYGMEGWVFLDDPLNQALETQMPANLTQAQALDALNKQRPPHPVILADPVTLLEPVEPPETVGMLGMAALLVAAVAAATVVLLVAIGKKRKKQ